MRKLSMDELGRKTVDEFKAADKTPLVLVLDNVRSMHNVGSVFRTADAFLLQGIVLCGYTPVPPHRDINKTALGATETVEWQYFPTTMEAVNALKSAGYLIITIEQAAGSVMLDAFVPPVNQPVALVFGNEVSGVDAEVMKMADGCIEIPQSGMKHSLNISVSTGIVVWDIFVKLRAVTNRG
ncbi:RNA methyltransferase [Chitinophaga flava]|nr:RNA methyltransferase [Chitinophaga flava]